MAARKKTPAPKRGTTDTPPLPALAVFLTGMFLAGLGIFLLLSFLTADLRLDPDRASVHCATGLVGTWAAFGVQLTIGRIPAFLVGFLCFLWGGYIMRTGRLCASWPRVLGAAVMVAVSALLLPALSGGTGVLNGGLLARTLNPHAIHYFGRAGLVLACVVFLALGSLLCFGTVVLDWVGAFVMGLIRVLRRVLFGTGRILGDAAARVQPSVQAAFDTAAERAIVLAPRWSRTREEEEWAEKEVEAAVIEETPPSAKRSTRIPDPDPVAPESAQNPGAEAFAYAEPDADEPDPVAPTPFQEDFPSDIDEVEDESGIEVEMYDDPDLEDNGEEGIGDEAEEDDFNPPPSRPSPYDHPESARVVSGKSVAPPPPEEDAPYILPPLTLLDDAEHGQGENATSLEKRARILENTLADFKIQGKVVRIECGPRVTQFEMTIAAGIRLSKVINLADNLTMALKAPSVRIIAPIPGRDAIGIEIPNIEQELVCLKDIVQVVERKHRKELLPLCLAKDVTGAPIVADLAKMPHLLIAGATGSGKSVCINSVVLSFLMCCPPHECKLIMVDPKVVELSRFKDIPHLMSPVITDMKRAVGVLEWACQEMDWRYEKLSMVSVNNLAKFNKIDEDDMRKRVLRNYGSEEWEMFPRRLPFIVIIIDELADLMMVAGKEVEQHITRLAAKSRAVGIHLILATQRPSVDVITGLIKANMPTRIAFQVASRVDSRTILDGNGAETLLGAGDMLYLPPGVGKVQRAQGVFVSDEELFRVVDFCKAQREPEYHADLEGPVIGGGKNPDDISDFDELFFESGCHIIESGRGSVSLLQRKLGIGYGRASRIIDQLAEAGILGPFREGKAREILLTLEEFEERFGSGAGSGAGAGGYGQAGLRDDEREPDDLPWDD